ncbi:hypothetical protein GCM10009634_43790 [Saccharothrix xinjiangensis]
MLASQPTGAQPVRERRGPQVEVAEFAVGAPARFAVPSPERTGVGEGHVEQQGQLEDGGLYVRVLGAHFHSGAEVQARHMTVDLFPQGAPQSVLDGFTDSHKATRQPVCRDVRVSDGQKTLAVPDEAVHPDERAENR